jgi:hypothetical protein
MWRQLLKGGVVGTEGEEREGGLEVRVTTAGQEIWLYNVSMVPPNLN